MFDPEAPPELAVSGWLNAKETLSLERLKGRVVVLVAFQMLCPGCVEHAIPQAKRLAARFRPEQVTVIGLHSVFEHHAAMGPAALEVFVSEWRLPFPVAIDQPGGEGIPRTMAAYQMQGTPSFLIFDRAGRLRRHYFGRPDDMTLAAEIMALAIEDKGSPRNEAALIERKIAATLAGESHDHGHDHGHHHHHDGACGCDHEHGEGHHHHAQAHGAEGSDAGGAVAAAAAIGPGGISEEVARRLAGADRMTEPPRDVGKPKG